jgi:hypothetical protein
MSLPFHHVTNSFPIKASARVDSRPALNSDCRPAPFFGGIGAGPGLPRSWWLTTTAEQLISTDAKPG